MARSPRLVARVVFVPGGAGAADARRRVVDVLMRAAIARAEPPDLAEPTPAPNPDPDASPAPGAQAACATGHMATIRRPDDHHMNRRKTT